MKKIIIYDFDGTLTPYKYPKYEIIEKSGFEGGVSNPLFQKLVNERARVKNIDSLRAVNETYLEVIKNAGFKLTNENFILGSDKIEYNKGVTEFLKLLCENNINNYIVSSGLQVFLENVSISPYFKNIFASVFKYDQNKEANGCYLMSEEKKVTTIKEILIKNEIYNEDCSSIIFIGDGLTDYCAMKFIKEHGGIAILVYQDKNNKEIQFFKEKNVVDFYTIADFSQNSDLYNYIKKLCNIK